MRLRRQELLVFSVLAISACDHGFVDPDGGRAAVDAQPITSQYKVVDGMLNFSDVEEFRSFYASILDLDETAFPSFMEQELYSKGFYSLMPSSSEANEQQLYEKHNSELAKAGVRSKSSASSVISLDDYKKTIASLEDVLGEERFASLLNQQGEIQVEGEVYKYTDTGIFTAPVGKKPALEAHFAKQSISSSFFDPTPSSKRSAYLSKSMAKVESCMMLKEQGR